jgi:hypothetical protein
MTVLWVKLRDEPRLSWHVVHQGNVPDGGSTRCGRPFGRLDPMQQGMDDPSRPFVVDLPQNERSCESCLRLHEWDEHRAANG